MRLPVLQPRMPRAMPKTAENSDRDQKFASLCQPCIRLVISLHIICSRSIKIPYAWRLHLMERKSTGKPRQYWRGRESTTRYNPDHKPAQQHFWRVFC